jgi:hypothetical protein
MRELYNWAWMQTQVTRTTDVWSSLAGRAIPAGRRYTPGEQQERERAYDEGLKAAESEARKKPRSKAERIAMRQRMVEAFARFSAVALDLDEDAIGLLTHEFLPVGTGLAGWARRFDANLSRADITQACRNAWTACGLQPLLGERIALTPSILAYSLLYPYSDNTLDRACLSTEAKLRFSERFRRRLRGESDAPEDRLEDALWRLVRMIEAQYPRELYPRVFECLLAIHRAQEGSLSQLKSGQHREDKDVLRVSLAKGGSSVLADACLARGWLSEEEAGFAFEWGVLLQLGDDIQDLREDMQRGSRTVFSQAVAAGRPLDDRVAQLLNFSEQTGDRMDRLPNGDDRLKGLLRMSWRSLILMAVAESHEFFSPEFLAEAEHGSPFRFAFLRARRQRLTAREGLYAMLFDAFLETQDADDGAASLLQDRLDAPASPFFSDSAAG